jgi:hypothetical protein
MVKLFSFMHNSKKSTEDAKKFNKLDKNKILEGESTLCPPQIAITNI